MLFNVSNNLSFQVNINHCLVIKFLNKPEKRIIWPSEKLDAEMNIVVVIDAIVLNNCKGLDHLDVKLTVEHGFLQSCVGIRHVQLIWNQRWWINKRAQPTLVYQCTDFRQPRPLPEGALSCHRPAADCIVYYRTEWVMRTGDNSIVYVLSSRQVDCARKMGY